MTNEDAFLPRTLSDLRAAWAIARKDIKIYYLKPNIIMSGVLFPLFMFLAFAMGRNAPGGALVPGLIAITALFSGSTIEPVSIPIERRVKTFDRFFAAPISLDAIVFGESLSGFLYSTAIGFVPLLIGMAFFGVSLGNPLVFLLGLGLASLCFAMMGTLFAAYPTESPGDVMSMVNLVRLPLIFVSGVFLPLAEMPAWGQTAALFSPLTYANDLIRYSVDGTTQFGIFTGIAVLAGYTILFHLVAKGLYRKFND
ncbi:MAG: ABC transporter permease [Methanoregulaceae archaeon]